MNAIKLLMGLVLLSFSFNCHAQIEDLPVSAAGASVLPTATYNVGLSAYIAGFFHSGGLTGYIWGEVGEKIEDQLGTLGIDITNDSGVLQHTVLITILNSGAISLTGEIGKQAEESLEQAFERNYASGILGVISREMTSWRFQELYWFAEANDWFNFQGMVGTTVGAQELFAGIINGRISWGTPVVEIIDCPDGVCEEIP